MNQYLKIFTCVRYGQTKTSLWVMEKRNVKKGLKLGSQLLKKIHFYISVTHETNSHTLKDSDTFRRSGFGYDIMSLFTVNEDVCNIIYL